ncbi:uncharacterized protein V1510DRAFT_421802 [Dipodascopsis tothii]|uniref:uncharacterized protein n=1 Tax=Dipodascopsis tothii TaxID=44089 RepID=UPI0034CF303C
MIGTDYIAGDAFVRDLAAFMRTYERRLAARRGPVEDVSFTARTLQKLSTTDLLQSSRPLRLSLTPHFLYYLTCRFEDIGLDIGPDPIELEGSAAASSLAHARGGSGRSRDRDRDSTSDARSVQSTQSSMSLSGVLSMFSFGGDGDIETDVRYIYTTFTLLSALRVAPEARAKTIEGFDDFHVGKVISLTMFKNVTSLELVDIDVQLTYGWHLLAEQLKHLSVQHSALDDASELLRDLVLDNIARQEGSRYTLGTHGTDGIPEKAHEPAKVAAEAHEPQAPKEATSLTVPSTPGLPVPRRTASPARKSANWSAGWVARSPPQRITIEHAPGAGAARLARGAAPSILTALTTATSTTTFDSTAPVRGTLPSSKWMYVRTLSLSHNGISSIAPMSMVSLGASLTSLDLSHNLLVSIPSALSSLSSLTSLDVSYNLLTSLHSLTHHPLPAVATIVLRGNQLASLAGLDRIVSLERVDLRDNALVDPMELARLTGAPDMTDLWVSGNPFVKAYTGTYRTTIFNLFRSTPGFTEDVRIDGNGPGLLEQRTLAERAEERAPSPGREAYPDVRRELATAPASAAASMRSVSTEKEVVVTPPTPPTQRGRVLGRNMVRTLSDESIDVRSVASSVASVLLDGTDRRLAMFMSEPNSRSSSVERERVKVVSPRTKKKHHRRRVIDIDGNSVAESERPRSRSPRQSRPPSVYSDRSVETVLSGKDDGRRVRQGEEYRKHIEALRSDVGSGWLSVLTEEAWNASVGR